MLNFKSVTIFLFLFLFFYISKSQGIQTTYVKISKDIINDQRTPALGLRTILYTDSLRNFKIPKDSVANFEIYQTFIMTNCESDIKFDSSQYFFTLVFETKYQKRFFIVDTDRDLNFLNDKFCNTSNYTKSEDRYSFQINAIATCKSDSKRYSLNVYASGFDYMQKIKLEFYSWKEKRGQVNSNIGIVNLYLTNWQKTPYFTKRNSFIFIQREDEELLESEEYFIGDTILIGKTFFAIQNVSLFGDTVFLFKIDADNLQGFRIGFKAPDFNEVDLINKRQISLSNRKYTIIESWGTWCVPCLELTYDVKKFYAQIGKEKFNMVSIANDDDSIKVIKYIKSKRLIWGHILQNRSGRKSKANYELLVKYRIEAYPTFFLIDPNGQIIYRGIGKYGFEKLKSIVLSIR